MYSIRYDVAIKNSGISWRIYRYTQYIKLWLKESIWAEKVLGQKTI